MALSRTVLLTVSALVLSTSGCVGGEEALPEPLHSRLQPMTPYDPGGQGGQNGLSTESFHAYAMNLRAGTMQKIFTSNSPLTPNLALNTLRLASAGGAETFRYAMECAYPELGGFTLDGVPPYVGTGFLHTLVEWPDVALDNDQVEDLFACMIARVNPWGTEVPIGFSGPSVPDPDDITVDFPFAEAVWTVDLGGTPSASPTYHVWPSPELERTCAQNTVDALNYRICGQSPELCSMVHETNFATKCSGTKGVYTCEGRPAIQTWLTIDDVRKLYPRCFEEP